MDLPARIGWKGRFCGSTTFRSSPICLSPLTLSHPVLTGVGRAAGIAGRLLLASPMFKVAERIEHCSPPENLGFDSPQRFLALPLMAFILAWHW